MEVVSIYNKRNVKKEAINGIRICCLIAMFTLLNTGYAFAQKEESKISEKDSKTEAKVTGLRNICVHVLQLEKTLKLCLAATLSITSIIKEL